jgi:hypothetical protein
MLSACSCPLALIHFVNLLKTVLAMERNAAHVTDYYNLPGERSSRSVASRFELGWLAPSLRKAPRPYALVGRSSKVQKWAYGM